MQEGGEFEASLGCIVSNYFKNKTKPTKPKTKTQTLEDEVKI